MKFSLLFLFSFISIACFSQEKLKYEPGFYRSNQEWIENKPSIPLKGTIEAENVYCGFKAVAKNLSNKDVGPLRKLITISLNLKPKERKEIGYIVGFSDGKNMYLTKNGLTLLDKKTQFSKVEFIENSHYFFVDWSHVSYLDYGFNTSPISEFPATRTVQVVECNIITQLYSSKTGKYYILTAKEVLKIIKEDESLYEEFLIDSERDQYLKEYVSKFIKRNY